MERVAVESSNILSVGYDEALSVLEVEFKGGSVYQYSGVPKEIAMGLIEAESPGKYFAENIRAEGYAYARV